MRRAIQTFLILTIASLSLPALAQQTPTATDAGEMNPKATARAFPQRGFSPYANRNYPTRVFWGDQHVHTGWSVDAGAFGCTLGPEEALRFARGEQVTSSLGEPTKLARPLDWVAVTRLANSGLGFDGWLRSAQSRLPRSKPPCSDF